MDTLAIICRRRHIFTTAYSLFSSRTEYNASSAGYPERHYNEIDPHNGRVLVP